MYSAAYNLIIKNGKKIFSELRCEFKYPDITNPNINEEDSRQRIYVKDKLRQYFENLGYALVEENSGKDLYGRWTENKYTSGKDITEELNIFIQPVSKLKLSIISKRSLPLEEIANLDEIDKLVDRALKEQGPYLSGSAEAKK